MRTYRMVAGLALVAALAAAPDGIRAQDDTQELPTVAVMDITGFMLGESGNSAPLGKAVSVMLITEMSGRPGMRIVERQDLRALLEEQALAVSGMVDDDTAIQIGRLLGAQYMIWGQTSIIGPMMRMDLRMVDVETSNIEPVLKLSGTPEEMLDILVRAADQFTEELELVTPSERAEMEEIPVQATLAFSRGINFEDEGRIEDAIAQYQATLEIHPTHRDARRALDRLQGGGDDR